jgi:hypothetical protein
MLSTILGDHDAAERHLVQAIAINERMGARPWTAHARHDLARLLRSRALPGDRARAAELDALAHETARAIGMTALERQLSSQTDRAAAPASVVASSGEFLREGEYWTASLGAEPVRIRDSKGMGYLARLLSRPGQEIHALDLVQGGSTGSAFPSGGDAALRGDAWSDAGPVLDARAKAAYRDRIAELDEEQSAADAANDEERAHRARAEIETIVEQLSAAVGIGGRDRPAGAVTERARISVTRAIRLALSRIGQQAPELGRHLDATIHTGTYCSYVPDPRAPISWRL